MIVTTTVRARPDEAASFQALGQQAHPLASCQRIFSNPPVREYASGEGRGIASWSRKPDPADD